MIYRCARIAVAALIDALFALRVERVGRRKSVEPAQVYLVIPDIKEVVHQVAQVADESAVAAQQLIVTLAAVLLASEVADYEIRASGGRPVHLYQPAVLRECRVGQPPVYGYVRAYAKEPCDGVMRVYPAAGPERVHAAARYVC